MKNLKIIPLSLLLLLSFSCVGNEKNVSLENDSVNTFSKKVASVDSLVTKSNIEQNLGVLSSKNKLPDGSVIPERGTTEGRQKTKEYIKSVLVGYGYKPEMHSYRKNGDNIFTILNAETTTDEYILVGAHMDSVKNMGADDNATAILIRTGWLRSTSDCSLSHQGGSAQHRDWHVGLQLCRLRC